MRLNVCLLLCLCVTVSFSQEKPSSCDNLLKTELDSVSGIYSRTSKDDILITKNGKNILNVVVLVMDRTVILSFNVLGGVYCIDETSKIEVTFKDSLTLEMPHQGKFNCDGDFSLFFYGSFGHRREFNEFMTVEISNIKVGLRKSVVDKTRENFIEASPSPEQSKLIMETLACLVE
jgi:hypothetical protein